MAIISQETWGKFTEEEKSELRKIYNEITTDYQEAKELGFVEKSDEIFERLIQLEIFFGKENLQSKPKTPKTWSDIEKESPDILQTQEQRFDIDLSISTIHFDEKVIKKCIAALKISRLIETSYGGIVTDEEWRNEDINKFSIVCEGNRLSIDCLPDERHFISFHYVHQAEEFMSYPENVELIKQYNML